MKTTVNYVIVADTETGGLPRKASKGKPEKRAFHDVALCEVAIVVVDCVNLRVVEEYSDIIKPYADNLEYSEGAEKVHGLTVKHLTENGKDVKEVYANVKNILKKYANPKIGSILAGHNFQLFDIPFFEGLFESNKDNLWDYVNFVEDTVKIAWYRSVEQENYKLGTCCRKEGVELVDAHRALNDTRANAYLFINYLKQLRGENVSSQKGENVRKTRFREKFQLV